MRDTVKQGSLLLQAVLMAQAAKQPSTAGSPRPAQPGTPEAPPPAAGSAERASADAEIEAKARRLLELATDEALVGLRGGSTAGASRR